jgi:hypothetical protein
MMEDETFFAWLDGELDEAEAARVAAMVAADPALSAKADAHRAMRSRLAAAFAPILDQPVPAALADTLEPRSNVVDFAAARARRRALPSATQWAAMAATLAIGLVTGTMIDSGSADRVEGATVLTASLGDALDSRLAADGGTTGPRVGLTYRAKDGTICRSFTEATTQGLACREKDGWAVKALLPSEGQAGDFRMAAGENPAIAALIDRTIAGEPFDAAQEKAAKEAGWR